MNENIKSKSTEKVIHDQLNLKDNLAIQIVDSNKKNNKLFSIQINEKKVANKDFTKIFEDVNELDTTEQLGFDVVIPKIK